MPDIARELGLSEAETSELVLVLARQQLQAESSAPVLHYDSARNLVQVDELSRSEVLAQRENFDREIMQLLGQHKHEKWKVYASTFVTRRLVQDLSVALSGTDFPLNPGQELPLRAALAEVEMSAVEPEADSVATLFGSSKSRSANQPVTALSTAEVKRRADFRTAAQPYLSTEQLREFDRLLVRIRAPAFENSPK